MTWASVLALCADDCMLHSLPSTRFAVVISQLPPFHRDLPCPAFPSAEQTGHPSVAIKMKRSRRTKGPGLRQGCAQRWKSSASFPRPEPAAAPGASRQMQLAAHGAGERGWSCRGPEDGRGMVPSSPRCRALSSARGEQREGAADRAAGPELSLQDRHPAGPRPGAVPSAPPRGRARRGARTDS